jgi:hypothetical protein
MADLSVPLVEALLVRIFRDHAFQLLHARLKDTAAFVKAASQEPGGPPDTPTQVLRLWASTLATAIPRLPTSVHKDVAAAMKASIPNLEELLQRVFLFHARTLLGQDVHGRLVHDLRVLPLFVQDAFQAFLNKLAAQDEVRLGTALSSPTVRDTVSLSVFRDMLAMEAMQGRVTVLPRKDPPGRSSTAQQQQQQPQLQRAKSQVVAGRHPTVAAPLQRYASALGGVPRAGGGTGSVSAAHGPVALLPPLLAPPVAAAAAVAAAATTPPASPLASPEASPAASPAASAASTPTSAGAPPPRGASLVPSVAPAKALLSNAPKEAATSVISAVTAMSAAGGMVKRPASVAPVPRPGGAFATVLGKTGPKGDSTLLMQRLGLVRPVPGTSAVTPGDSASQVTSMGMRHRQELQSSDATNVHRRHLATVGAEVREVGTGEAAVVPIAGGLQRQGPLVTSTITERSEDGSSSDGSATS